MLVSTKGRYALRVMVDLAEHQGDRYIPLKEIAERQEISEKYLETILKVLVQEKMLVGLRGKGGGYKLSRAPEQYTVGSVIRLTEGSLAPVSCLERCASPCARAAECRTLPMWQRFNEVMNEFFDGYTIADLMRTGQGGDDYVI
ncbi:MAG: Rrf2 family transcriptional regulator [Oscillospiraceae bacterium]|nr:Rrf2 family transcriptional regulator [Oscillospiraceae bacterium]